MIKQYGAALYKISGFLTQLESRPLKGIDSEGAKELGERFGGVKDACYELGLEQTPLFIESLISKLGAEKSLAEIFTSDKIQSINTLLQNELTKSFFKNLTTRQAALYNTPEPFGAAVALRFAKAVTDIEEAGKCLALDRPTACVFHLMRVMESGVQSFGKKMGVVLPEEKTWQRILDDLNAPIKALPEKDAKEKALKESLAELHVSLFSVKFAWRNPVMHPKESYSPEEASEIYEAVKIFMRRMAEVL